jgi:hypothetical protein
MAGNTHIPVNPHDGDTTRRTECGITVAANQAPTVLYHAGPERYAQWAIFNGYDRRCSVCIRISREKYNDLPARIGCVPSSATQQAAVRRQQEGAS